MPDEKISVAQRIRDRLDAGALRLRISPKKMWSGFGKRHTCDGCGKPILPIQVECEFVVDDDAIYRFHICCAAGLWQAELKRRGVGVAEGHRSSRGSVSALDLCGV